jgi:hypothetical protein
MKSKIENLVSRGFVDVEIENKYLDTTFSQRVELLRSELPTDRTLGARLLAGGSDLSAIDYLIQALIKEKKLYPKIEICNTLASFGKNAVIPLIGLLGKIGNNQYKKVSENEFKKNNYPLPRDIAARTLVRIGTEALPDLLRTLNSDNLSILSEAIDAIGFICFYKPQSNLFLLLKKCFYRNQDSDLIKWKIFRAMSAFSESVSFLKEQQKKTSNEYLLIEIRRSLLLIKQERKTNQIKIEIC